MRWQAAVQQACGLVFVAYTTVHIATLDKCRGRGFKAVVKGTVQLVGDRQRDRQVEGASRPPTRPKKI